MAFHELLRLLRSFLILALVIEKLKSFYLWKGLKYPKPGEIGSVGELMFDVAYFREIPLFLLREQPLFVPDPIIEDTPPNRLQSVNRLIRHQDYLKSLDKAQMGLAAAAREVKSTKGIGAQNWKDLLKHLVAIGWEVGVITRHKLNAVAVEMSDDGEARKEDPEILLQILQEYRRSMICITSNAEAEANAEYLTLTKQIEIARNMEPFQSRSKEEFCFYFAAEIVKCGYLYALTGESTQHEIENRLQDSFKEILI